MIFKDPRAWVVHSNWPNSSGTSSSTFIASDGLWDVCSHTRAVSIARASDTPQRAAQNLLELAEKVYLQQRGKKQMGDDTTVMCIDLNPSLLSFEAESPSLMADFCTIH